MTISWMGVLVHAQTLIQNRAGYGPPSPDIIGLSMFNLISDLDDAALSD